MNLKQPNSWWFQRLKNNLKKMVLNPDIALGFFLGSSVTSIIWIIMQATM